MTTSSTSWHSLLAAKKSKLSEEGCKIDEFICDEASFVNAFKKLCTEKKENFPVQFINRLVYSCKKIHPFVEAIAEKIPDLSPSDLKGLVWGATYALIKYGTKDRSKLPTVVQLLVDLNNALIPIAIDNGLHPYELALQLPLKNFFEVYTDSYTYVVSVMKEHGQDPTPKPIEFIRERNRKLEESKKQYQEQLVEEKANQERRHQEEGRRRGKEPLMKGHGSAVDSDHWVDARFVFKGCIGNGYCSTVDKVQELSTNEYYACKTIYFSHGSSEDEKLKIKENAKEEVKIMRKLRHEHIVSVLFHVQREDRISILMTPIAEKNLKRYLNDCISQEFPIAMVDPIFRWFGSLLQALAYAHQRKIRHKDIKPANILIEGGQPYLADFGLALDFTERETSSTRSIDVHGTPVYYAPECSPGGDHGPAADVFALGCVFSEMFTVANKKTLQDFRDHRYTEEEGIDGHHAFRKNLPRVKSWINKLSKSDGNELLGFIIQEMIQEDIGTRKTARTALQSLMRNKGLFIKDDCLSVSTDSAD